MILTIAIAFFCIISFILYFTAISKFIEIEMHSDFTSSRKFLYFYFILGLAPFYFLYRDDTLMWTILKYIGIFIFARIMVNILLENESPEGLSILSMFTTAVAVVLIVTYFLIRKV